MSYALVAPQIIVTLLFFVWPAAQALYLQDAFGGYSEFAWLDNFHTPFSIRNYRCSFRTTAIFSLLVAVLGLSLLLTLAAFADRVIKGASIYKILLILPYAISPIVIGMLWTFMLDPTLRIVSNWLHHFGIEWNHISKGHQAMILIMIAALWKQVSCNLLFFLASLQVPPQKKSLIDGAGPVKSFRTIILPLLLLTTFFLLVVNIVYAFFDTFAISDVPTLGGPEPGYRYPWSTKYFSTTSSAAIWAAAPPSQWC